MENRISSGLFFPQTPQIGGCDYAPPRFCGHGNPRSIRQRQKKTNTQRKEGIKMRIQSTRVWLNEQFVPAQLVFDNGKITAIESYDA